MFYNKFPFKFIDDTIKYSLETINNGDYETLFAVVGLDGIPENEVPDTF